MIRLRGARVVTPERVLDGATVVVADGRIVEIIERATPAAPGDVDCAGGWVVPGFVDAHVHGSHGIDTLDGPDAVSRLAAVLPRYGVTSFLPTSVACPPDVLAQFLASVEVAMRQPGPAEARVLGAHLESNFINPDYKGAQPASCLRLPPRPGDALVEEGVFSGAAVRHAIAVHAVAVRIVTLAPELPGGLDLVRDLVAAGHRVSLGHSAATFDEAEAALAAGARHATHLFNRMPPLSHRAPGLAGAMLAAPPDVTCEIVADGFHVHPAMMAVAMKARGRGGLLAITDATAAAGLPRGSKVRLGEHELWAGEHCAELADGTVAGSITTMDAAFRRFVAICGVVDAVHCVATTPAAAAGRPDLGRLAEGVQADLVVLDGEARVRQTWVGGRLAWNSDGPGAVSPVQGA